MLCQYLQCKAVRWAPKDPLIGSTCTAVNSSTGMHYRQLQPKYLLIKVSELLDFFSTFILCVSSNSKTFFCRASTKAAYRIAASSS